MNAPEDTFFLVNLNWDILFRDSDEGDCFAGSGVQPLMAFPTREGAEHFVARWSERISRAEREETTWFPVGPESLALKEALGVTLEEADPEGRSFCLVVQEIPLKT